jgi:hypothetical protein
MTMVKFAHRFEMTTTGREMAIMNKLNNSLLIGPSTGAAYLLCAPEPLLTIGPTKSVAKSNTTDVLTMLGTAKIQSNYRRVSGNKRYILKPL